MACANIFHFLTQKSSLMRLFLRHTVMLKAPNLKSYMMLKYLIIFLKRFLKPPVRSYTIVFPNQGYGDPQEYTGTQQGGLSGLSD